jgi:hypothetical protein
MTSLAGMTNISGADAVSEITGFATNGMMGTWSFNLGTGGDIFGEGAEHGLAVRANRRC